MKTSARAAAAIATGTLLAIPPAVPAHAAPRPGTAHAGPRAGTRAGSHPGGAVRPGPRPGPAHRTVASGPPPAAVRQAAIRRFWTPARMRSARPLDAIVVTGAVPPAVSGGPATETPATPSSPGAARASGAAWTSGGTVAHTAGRVFFTYQGRPASCSGDAVTSANKSTVLTAGHCVRLSGEWHRDWVFVPGYHEGQTPFGTWTLRRALTTPQWEAREDLAYDVGAAVVNPLGGRTLTSVVGGQGVAFDQKRGQTVHAFGYPVAEPYDGSRLVHCSGTTFDDHRNTRDEGLSCDMASGSSGGPWFLGFDDRTGAGTQNSVNSFKYDSSPDQMFGPYFGADAKALYDKAQNT